MSTGNIVQVIGAVVDVQFPRDGIPKVYDALQLDDRELTLETTNKVLARVELSVDRGTLIVTLERGQWTSIRELDAALAATGAKVRREALRLPPYSRTLLGGVGEKDVGGVRSALIDSKLFDGLSVVPAAETKQLWFTPVLKASRVKTSDVLGVLAKTGKTFTIDDVRWTTPCASCASKKTLRTSCKRCWG